jgi:hypothetical protein
MNDRLTPDDSRDMLRTISGIFIALAAAMIFVRKGWFFGANPEQWAAFPMFLVLVLPAVFLYGAVMTTDRTRRLRAWQAVYSVAGLVFVPFALLQLVDMLGGDRSAPLNIFWTFGVTAGLAFYAGAVGVRVQFLLGSLAAIVSWTALWDKLLSDGITTHWGAYRGLLGLLAIALLVAALYAWRTNPGGDETAETATGPAGDLGLWKASELLTGAGIAAVIACALGISAIGNLNPLGTAAPPVETNTFWDVLLLLVSLGLVGIASVVGVRGPAYVGGIGLFLFVVIVGLDLNSDQPNPFKFGIWPWILLIGGLIGVGLSSTREASLGDQPSRFVRNLRGR